MKKIFSIIILFLLFVAKISAQADAADSVAINNFIKQLHGLDSADVSTICSDSRTMLDDIKRQAQMCFGEELDNTMFSGLGDIWEKGYYQLSFVSDNDAGHKKILDLIERYNVTCSDELFGVPLVTAMREDFEEQYLFSDYKNTFIFRVDDFEASIVYANYPLLDLLKNIMFMLMVSVNESVIDLESLVQGNVALSLSVDDLSWKQVVGGSVHPADDSDVSMKSATDDETVVFAVENKSGLFGDNLMQPNDAEMQRLRDAISKLEYPAFLENRTTGKYFVAIPQVPAEWVGECEPYALSNIYDWINETGLGNGVNSVHRQAAIITPRDVLLQYATEYLAGKDTTFVGYPDELKKVYATEYQGGTPAVLYSKSLTPDGYNDMINALEPIFNIGMGDCYKNLKVTQRLVRDGYRYVQLYGDAGVLVYIMDSFEEKYCQIFITIGVDAFAHAVNACTIGGEANIADNCNIAISENGISFQPGNVGLPSDSNCGVRIASAYLNKILGK